MRLHDPVALGGEAVKAPFDGGDPVHASPARKEETFLKVTRRKARFLNAGIDEWTAEGTLTAEEGRRLRDAIEVVNFDWMRLAKYSFWISLLCLVIAFGAVLGDRLLMGFLAEIFTEERFAWYLCLFFALLACGFYWLGIRRNRKSPERVFSNEALFFLGVMATAAFVVFLGRALDTGSGQFSSVLLISFLLYAVLGLWFPSKLVWVFALLSLGGWFGARTGYVSGWGAYYLGMNYPLRFVFFGLGLTVSSVLFDHIPARREFLKPTRAVGLLYLFIALWILSIFGNYGDIQDWFKAEQWMLLHWAAFFALFAILAILYGVQFDDPMTRGFGITFLFINLYTRYFELFWDSLHKALFFALLALSFWVVGSHAEKIRNVSILRRRPPPKQGVPNPGEPPS